MSGTLVLSEFTRDAIASFEKRRSAGAQTGRRPGLPADLLGRLLESRSRSCRERISDAACRPTISSRFDASSICRISKRRPSFTARYSSTAVR